MLSFSVDSFVPPLISLLGEGNSADTMLLAARALTHLMDALPASASAIAHNNAAAPLCANLLAIEYIDLAEQSLAALEKLSVDFPQVVVRAGGFAAALSYIDFFSTGVQRMAAVTACNLCRAPPSDSMDKIVDVLPSMMNLLNSDDQRIRESATLGFSRLAESFRTSPDKLETLNGSGDAKLIARVIALLVPTSPPTLSPQSYSAALRLLSTLGRGSAVLSSELLSAEPLAHKIKHILSSGSSPHALDCLTLADSLLPEPARQGDNVMSLAMIAVTSSPRFSRRRRSGSNASSTHSVVDTLRRQSIENDPNSLLAFGSSILQTLLSFHNSAADSAARRLSLSVITKVMVLTPSAHLKSLLRFGNRDRIPMEPLSDIIQFVPFLASLLGENCAVLEMLAGLCMADAVLKKLPDVKSLLLREGVFFEILRLRDGEQRAETPANPASAERTARDANSSDAVTGHTETVVDSTCRTASSSTHQTDGSQGASAVQPSDALQAIESSQSGLGFSGLPTSSETGAAIGSQMLATSAALGTSAARFSFRLSSLRHSYAPEYTMSTVHEAAKFVAEEHIKHDDIDNERGEFILGQLENVCKELRECANDEHSTRTKLILRAFVALICGEMGISTFELQRSGVIDALVMFFDANGLPEIVRTQRSVAFFECLNERSDQDAFSTIVALVLGALAAEEKLPVCVSDQGNNGPSSSSMTAGLRQLSQPFKLCLRRAESSDGGSNLRDYSHSIVLIEPLATMSSVQDFLWNRVHNGTRDTNTDGSDNTEENPAAGTHADEGLDHDSGDMVLDIEGDDGSDHQHMDEQDSDENEEHEGSDDDDDDDDDDDNDDDDDDDGHDDEDENDDGEEDTDNRDTNQREMFDVDDDADGDHGDEDIDNDDQQSEGEYASGSDDMIDDDDDDDDIEQHHDNLDDSAFSPNGLGTSLPAVELDHDDLGGAFPLSPSASSAMDASEDRQSRPGESSRNASSGSRSQSSIFGIRSRSHAIEGSESIMPRSYAAALASGMHAGYENIAAGHGRAGPHRNRSGSPDVAKLKFSLNGVAIPSDCSILHAVLRTRNGNAVVGPRLWSEVHTLVYSLPESESIPATSAEDPATSFTMPFSADRSVRRSRRLSSHAAPQTSYVIGSSDRSSSERHPSDKFERADFGQVLSREILERPTAFVPELAVINHLTGSIQSIVRLLRHLFWMHSKMQPTESGRTGLAAMGAIENRVVGPASLSPAAFMSQKITAKLQRQLSDPLALCGGAIPGWCHTLAREASFLIPFQTRQVLFQSTALGISRALNLLQQRFDIMFVGGEGVRHGLGHRFHSARDSEVRIHRIQRQKVRIHRSRVLESAARVMSTYASHPTVLEVEYFDEVGTGLGPTLEFYTLVSRELQRADIGLWRSQMGRKSRTSRSRRTAPDGAVSDISASRSVSIPRSLRPSTRSRRRGAARDPDLCSGRRKESIPEQHEYVVSTGHGLTPSCIPAQDIGSPVFAEILSYFPFIGRLAAKALSDGRLLDLRFSHAFSKLILAFCSLMLKKGLCQDRTDLSSPAAGFENISSTVVSRLEQISDAELWREFADGNPGLVVLRTVDSQLATSLQNILDLAANDPESVEDLCLSFVLPEDDQIELVAGGKDVTVTAVNAYDYVAAVARFVLCTGIRRQAEAFIGGFCHVLDATVLLLFQPHELELLMCGPAYEEWSRDFLVRATRCDHGYRHESQAVEFLFRVLSELGVEDQRRFVLFATGSPALPVGGLMGLHPRLTIVKRTPEGGRCPDECLPTVMTCTNYFKLPDYSSYDITKDRLLYALREGQGSFHLS